MEEIIGVKLFKLKQQLIATSNRDGSINLEENSLIMLITDEVAKLQMLIKDAEVDNVYTNGEMQKIQQTMQAIMQKAVAEAKKDNVFTYDEEVLLKMLRQTLIEIGKILTAQN